MKLFINVSYTILLVLLPFVVVNGEEAEVRTLNLAVIQSESKNGEITGNLKRAEYWVEYAAEAGAELILFSEFMPTGYELTDAIWKAAETMDGETVTWMRKLSAVHKVWLGTSFLESDNGEYFNSFVLTNPKGEVAGKVRKEVPASEEVYFFNGEVNSHYIDTEIGRIGVMICYENYLSAIANKVAAANVDLLLMPFSFPHLTNGTDDLAQPLSGEIYASVYSRAFGVPAAAVNKVGAWQSGSKRYPGFIAKGYFPGLGAIANSDGQIIQTLDGQAGFAMGKVELNPRRKKQQVFFNGEYVPALVEKSY